MKKINFEDATLEQQGHVEIDGRTYNIVDAVYSGGTDLDADTFNQMQDNIEEEFSKIITDNIWNVDPNTLTDTRMSCCSLTTNTPDGTEKFGTIIVQKYGDNYCSQIFTDINTGITHQRSMLDNVWQNWKTMTSSNKVTFNNVWYYGHYVPGSGGVQATIPINNPAKRPIINNLTKVEWFNGSSWVQFTDVSITLMTESFAMLSLKPATGIDAGKTVLLRINGNIELQ